VKHTISLTKPSNIIEWGKIYTLYRSAFPVTERKPFSIILSMYKKGKTDVWYCTENGSFLGFAATINDDSLILLDYFAVVKRKRQKGFGSAILKALQTKYIGKGLFVEIESAYEDVPDKEVRLRRKQFYLSCGMRQMNVMADVFGTKMELLAKDCIVDFPTYHAFYKNNYSELAAKHIREEYHPEA